MGNEIGEDKKWSENRYCIESNNGICLAYIDYYYLGLDNRIFDNEHCIYSTNYSVYFCEIFKNDYYHNHTDYLRKIKMS